MFGFFQKWLNSKGDLYHGKGFEAELRQFQQFLDRKVSFSSMPAALQAFYNNFFQLSTAEMRECLPQFYLSFEQHFAELRKKEGNERQKLRLEIIQRFPNIAKANNLSFVFYEQDQIELKLCRLFLSEVLKEVINVLGQAKENYFETAKHWVEEWEKPLQLFPFLSSTSDFSIDSVNYLAEVSQTINETLTHRMGNSFAQRAYEKCYKTLADNYRYLSEFPSIISLIPKAYLDTDKIGLLSNHQLANTLLSKVNDLEELNQRLTQRNKDLREAQAIIEREKSKSENALLRLQEVMNAVGDGIITANTDSKIVMVNKEVEKIWGYTAEELIDQNLTILMPNRYQSRHQKGMDTYVKSRISTVLGQNVVMEGVRKDGTEFPVEIHISDLEYQGTHLFTAAVRDISERIKTENELLNSRHELQIRTRELERIRGELEVTVHELRDSNIELEKYAYVVSHDLQAPLQSIHGYVQLLGKKKELDEAENEYIQHIKGGVARMQDLIKNLLEYSRIGRVGVRPIFLELDVIIQLVSYNLRKQIEDSNAKISYQYNGKVLGDKTQMIQLFQNLISNSIKFRRADRRSEVQVIVTEKEHDLQFEIRDNGIGIKEVDKDIIFAVFQKGQSNPGIKGTGIGLAICKKIVELHHGEIWVEPNDLGGSSFFFTLAKESKEADVE
ncbi:MAG: PAS domain S-box protein [Saprospiraceae bacterium]|nr:PAS domain S-box protein [Saprospiraceae bacterium]